MSRHRSLLRTTVSALALTAPAIANAQEPAPAAPPAGDSGGEGSGQSPVVIELPPSPPIQVQTPGYPAPGVDPNAHLPSSSRGTTDTTNSSDGFDLVGKGAGAQSVHGNESGSYVVESQYVPEGHTVRRGDTLWDISGQYYKNPYNWPRVWAFNPQIQNPHWIYPGDRVRLRESGQLPSAMSRLTNRSPSVPPETVFLRDVGFIDDPKEETWGQIVGANNDQMLLSEGHDVYVRIDGNHEISVGQELTIFRPLREVKSDSNKEAKGQLVSIRGSLRIDRYNPTTHMARARIIESLDLIERGWSVGPIGRRFDVVPPSRNEEDLEVRILASLYPHQFYGQNQVVFLDRGEKEGLRPGNRLFAIRRGDRWRNALPSAGSLAALRPKLEDDHAAEVEPIDDYDYDTEQFPDETYAEIRVLRVRDHTATAIVTASTHEIERTARLIARKGY